jgi:hypothetical protein
MCKADNLTTRMCQVSWNPGASYSWKSHGLFRPVQRLRYLYVLKYETLDQSQSICNMVFYSNTIRIGHLFLTLCCSVFRLASFKWMFCKTTVYSRRWRYFERRRKAYATRKTLHASNSAIHNRNICSLGYYHFMCISVTHPSATTCA